MLKILVTRSQNQRQKGMKVKLVVRTWLVLAVSVWMIYQLRLFLNHKLSSSENGSSIKEDTQFEELKLGRKGLLLVDSEKIKPDKEEGKDKAMEEENSELKHENQEEVEEQSGDGDDEDLDTVRFDDPMEEIDSLNNDNDDDEKIDQQNDEEDDGTIMKGNEDKVDGNENDSLESLVTVR